MDHGLRERLGEATRALMLIPGVSGHEGRVRKEIAARLAAMGIAGRTDRLGNLVATIEGDAAAPSVMLIAHMDQLGMVVRRIEPDGFVRVQRSGGIPERALPAQPVRFMLGEGRDHAGVVASKSHHATSPEERYRALPIDELYIDVGLEDAAAVRRAGIEIGTPVVYEPNVVQLSETRLGGTSVDDRAACAVVLEVARAFAGSRKRRPTVHLVFSVQEEFNVRGALVAAQALTPEIAIQLDLTLATDTPDMAGRGEARLGGGPAMGHYSFHGRGTLNGTIPHPALVGLFASTAVAEGIPLQRSAQIGILTETAYVQLVGEGVAAIDLAFPARYTHSAVEVLDLGDLEGLAALLIAALPRIDGSFSLDRDDFIT